MGTLRGFPNPPAMLRCRRGRGRSPRRGGWAGRSRGPAGSARACLGALNTGPLGSGRISVVTSPILMPTRTLLCVEPDEAALAIIAGTLEPYGFEIKNITNGAQVVDWHRKNRQIGRASCRERV